MIDVLPFPPRRAWLLAFTVSTSLAIASAACLLLFPVFGSAGVALGVVVGLLFAAIGFLSPQVSSFLYRAYNKVVRVFTAWAITWISVLCYFLIFRAASWFGSPLAVGPMAPGKSNWTPVESFALRADDERASRSTDRGRWVRDYLSWCVRSKNLWAVCLLPFLLLLSLLQSGSEDQSVVPGNIYTLY